MAGEWIGAGKRKGLRHAAEGDIYRLVASAMAASEIEGKRIHYASEQADIGGELAGLPG